MPEPLISQKMVDAFTEAFNESLSGMTFQEVVNLALTGYLSIEIKKAYQTETKLWHSDANQENALHGGDQEIIS